MEDRPLTNPYDDVEHLASLKGFAVEKLEDHHREFWRRILAKAWEQGRAARAGGRENKCPLSNYPSRAVRVAWEEGWCAAHAAIASGARVPVRDRVPDLHSQDPGIRER